MGRLSRFVVNVAKDAAEAAAEKAERGVVKAERKAAKSLAVTPKPKPKPVVRALPAPPKPLALPAPGPGLPEYAVKPKGGQWYVNDEITGANFSPENAALRMLPGNLQVAAADTPEGALRDWWLKAAPRYIKNDLGTPDDPLRALAEQGLLHTDMTPDAWSFQTQGNIINDPISSILLGNNRKGGMPGAGDDLRGEVMTKMPWLAKVPVTDEVYGVTETSLRNLEFPHLIDEMRNALLPEMSGLPADLAVRPESLARMGLPQAAERVARINQFRVKQAEQAALSAMDSPAVHTFKEYPENNPMGLRWVEMAPPKGDGPTNYDVEEELQKALKYEGDTMGHCVGGYCDDVLSGRSRIFSLRDAKGEPHVTVETSPGRQRTALSDIPRDALDEITAAAKAETDQVAGPMGIRPDDPRWVRTYQTNLKLKQNEWLRNNPTPDDIVQIKGKQNRAPKDDYLPFVQDFVKSQKWGNIGDFGNTGLVRLPDGRYITQQQYDEGMTKAFGANAPELLSNKRLYGPDWFERNWAEAAPHFEGFAIGGRVERDRCFCRHPMAVR